MDPHGFDADPEPDPDPAQNLDADPDPDPDPGGGGPTGRFAAIGLEGGPGIPGGGEGVGQPKMCIPPGKILGTPLF